MFLSLVGVVYFDSGLFRLLLARRFQREGAAQKWLLKSLIVCPQNGFPVSFKSCQKQFPISKICVL